MKVYSGLVLAAAVVTGAAAAAQTTAQPSVSVVITQGVTTTLVMPAWASSVFTETGAPIVTGAPTHNATATATTTIVTAAADALTVDASSLMGLVAFCVLGLFVL